MSDRAGPTYTNPELRPAIANKDAQHADYTEKRPYDLMAASMLKLASVVLGYGAKKYDKHNWRKGMPWSDVYRALIEHLNAWWEGEDYDPESELPHLGHAACCLMFLCEYWLLTRYARFDDRYYVEGEDMSTRPLRREV